MNLRLAQISSAMRENEKLKLFRVDDAMREMKDNSEKSLVV